MATAIRRAGLFLALGACAAMSALLAGQDKPAGRPADKPLVRVDLLAFGPGEIAPPIRDIFRPVAVAPGPGSLRPARPVAKPAVAEPEAVTPPSFDLSLTYIGSVKSGRETLALVLRGGQTESVREGDEIVPGYKVVRVTPEAVVVQGPTGETRTFPKQGERP